ncbi:MAG TPA: beta-L-arabinofuranosidase domain-containing protein [Candidatus Limnocylindria bacterium]|nr:beta-L-arabinofuranosidase domain-containing protein [Candidatus Limnocylindria bacterium]
MAFANWEPVTFDHVHDISGFWRARVDAVRGNTVRVCLEQCEKTGRLANFRRAAGLEEGPFEGRYYNDSDVYKVLEGIAYVLMHERDPALEARADGIISDILAAQWEDGYVNTFYTLTAPGERWTDMAKHEDYCIGHMIEAAVAYFQATGKRAFLDGAVRAAEHMMSLFGPDKRHWVVGHQEPELALVRLWRLTGRQEFLDFARWLLLERGRGHLESAAFERIGFQSDYVQDDVPAEELEKVVGHAVRAMYYYSAMADVAMARGDETLRAPLLRLWDNVVPANLYVTGGIGQEAGHEGFTRDFHKPNLTAYCETCAAIGMALWNQRMCLMEGDAKYADLVETELYNGILSGISLDGTLFFYENPLSSVGVHRRQPWYDCSCCPTNLVRFIPSVGGYAFAADGDTLVVNQFLASRSEIPLAGGTTRVEIATEYPWDGAVAVRIPDAGACRALRIRIPGWCGSWDLYRNGERVHASPRKGYVEVPANSGDEVRLAMELPVRILRDDERVLENRGRAAVARGPVVYCAEEADNPGFVREYFHAEADLRAEGPRRIPGAEFFAHPHREDGAPGKEPDTSALMPEAVRVALDVWGRRLIPYFAWDNRGPGAMAVWLKDRAGNG